MTEINQLFGGCACERNQYAIVIPSASANLAQVFFDNSASSRKVQASPVTAWLRVPLDWYQSVTVAQFFDESHSSIKRTFNTSSTRRQFCGYCGSHLTQWSEVQNTAYASARDPGYLDVTLGSLLNESLEKLEALHILPDLESDEDSTAAAQGLVGGSSINEEDHIPTNEQRPGGVDEPSTSRTVPRPTQELIGGDGINEEDHIPTTEQMHGGVDEPSTSHTILRRTTRPLHLMRGRGIPFFEEMIDHSRLGRIKRQAGDHTSPDGTMSVQWEVVEIAQSPEPTTAPSEQSIGYKRQKLDR